MKRINYLIFTFMVSFFCINVVSAKFTTSVEIPKKTYAKGDEVVITLNLSGIDSNGLSSAEYIIETKGITYVCDENIKFLQGKTDEVDCSYQDGKLILLYVDSDLGESPITNGDFIKLTAVASEDIKGEEIFSSLVTEGYAQVINNKVVPVETDLKFVDSLKASDGEKDKDGEEIENPNTGIFLKVIIMLLIIAVVVAAGKAFRKYKAFNRV